MHFRNYEKSYDLILQIDADNGNEIKYNEVESIVKKFGSVFAKKGIQNQDVVALCISNNIYYPMLIMGISTLNAITTTSNPNYTKGKTAFNVSKKITTFW